eukprot:218649_1
MEVQVDKQAPVPDEERNEGELRRRESLALAADALLCPMKPIEKSPRREKSPKVLSSGTKHAPKVHVLSPLENVSFLNDDPVAEQEDLYFKELRKSWNRPGPSAAEESSTKHIKKRAADKVIRRFTHLSAETQRKIDELRGKIQRERSQELTFQPAIKSFKFSKPRAKEFLENVRQEKELRRTRQVKLKRDINRSSELTNR